VAAVLLLAACASSAGTGTSSGTPAGPATPTPPSTSVASRTTPATQPTSAGSRAQPLKWNFDADPVGQLPQGAVAFSGTWAVRAESGTPSPPNALCQTGSAEFPALALGDAVFADVVLSARFKPISGSQDQAGGLIFRIQDKDNYYILRANALEGNVNLYKYAGGRRSDLKGGSAKVVAGQWQELRVEVAGNRFHGFLDGQQVVEATDGSYTSGRVGLWTKADSVTCFDDVQAQGS
jgi:hypothetical protein